MNTNDIDRKFPLFWPADWPRTPAEKIKKAQFKDRSLRIGSKEIDLEVRRFRGKDLVISANLALKTDGSLRSVQRQPYDRGVAIFFEKDGEQLAIACDIYNTVEDNLWALVRTLQSLRQIERDGSPTIINKAFQGFAALPDPGRRQWWEVLGVSRDEDPSFVRLKYFQLAEKTHPDKNNGDAEEFLKVQKAYEEFQQAMK